MNSSVKCNVPALSLPPIFINNMPGTRLSLDNIAEEDVTEPTEDFRPRSSTFSGLPARRTSICEEQEETKSIKSTKSCTAFLNTQDTSLSPSSPRSPPKSPLLKRFQQAAHVLGAKEKEEKDKRENNILSQTLPGSKKSFLAVTEQPDASGPETGGTNRKLSVTSVVGLVLFKKLYQAELDIHVKKHLDEQPEETDTKLNIASNAEWETTDSEAESDDNGKDDKSDDKDTCTRRENAKKSKKRGKDKKGDFVKPSLSAEGQVAMLRCYDEKLKEGISGLYPKYRHALYRTKTPTVKMLSDRSSETEKSKNSPRVETSKKLRRAGVLLDAMKAERGEHISTEKYLSKNGNRLRPKSRRLVKKYNTWTNTWKSIGTTNGM